METPSSSTRRVTRSKTLIASASNSNLLLPRKLEESEKTITMKSRQRSGREDQSALIDITNDSPIVGLAMENLKTPSSAMSKKKRMISQGKLTRTPGSGEALLRGQVKSLLQKVEEEAELSKMVTLQESRRPFFINRQGILNSPVNLVAPTPANTPQILNFDSSSSPVEDKFLIQEMISEMLDEKKKKEWETESENLVTRSLLLDFSEKSSDSLSSVLTYKGRKTCQEDAESSLDDDDDESVWSIQMNPSSNRDDEEEENDFGYNINDGGLLDDLCEDISKISVGGIHAEANQQ